MRLFDGSHNFMDICILAKLEGDTRHPDCKKWFGYLEVNLWTDCNKPTRNQTIAWKHTINKSFSEQDRTGSC